MQKQMEALHEPFLSRSSGRKEAHSIRARSSGKRSEPFDRLRVYLVTSAYSYVRLGWVHGPNARARHVQVDATHDRPATARRGRGQAGTTLMEIVIAVALTTIAGTALLILSSSTGRSLAEMSNYVDLDHENRMALDNLTRDLRQVRYLTGYSVNSVVCTDKDGAELSYVYSPTDRTLIRTKNGLSTKLLNQCDQLKFAIYQRNPQSNTYAMISTTMTNCKVITVTWSCSRSLFGRKINTEQGQTARIVIRNKKET